MNSTSPEISIIVPVYKVEQYLDRCVESILKQTFTDFELILVDDGSPDNCPKMCDEWAKKDSRIKVIHKKNGGLSSARNAGLDVARGKYIGFVDSDDWIAPDMYMYLINLIKRYNADVSECSMFYPSQYELCSDSAKEKVQILDQEKALKDFFRILRKDINYIVCNKLYKKPLIQDIRFPNGMIFEDIDFNFKVYTRLNLLVVSNSRKYYYYKNPNGISRNAFRKKDFELIDVWDKIVMKSSEVIPKFHNYALYNRYRADFGLLCKLIRYGNQADIENPSTLKKEFQSKIRKNYFKLMAGNMPINRKLLLTILCVNYKPVDWFFSLLRYTNCKKKV